MKRLGECKRAATGITTRWRGYHQQSVFKSTFFENHGGWMVREVESGENAKCLGGEWRECQVSLCLGG